VKLFLLSFIASMSGACFVASKISLGVTGWDYLLIALLCLIFTLVLIGFAELLIRLREPDYLAVDEQKTKTKGDLR
jgi:hypothetical protein